MTNKELKDIAGNPPPYCELQKLVENELHQFSWLGDEEINRLSSNIASKLIYEGYGLRREVRKNLIEQGIAPRIQALEKGLYGALACFEDDKTAAGVLRFAKAIEAYEDLANFIKEIKLDD